MKRLSANWFVSTLLTGLFLFAILAGQRFLPLATFWSALLVALLLTFIFQPLRELAQRLVDRFSPTTQYDYRRILGRYSRALTRPVTDLDKYAKMASYLLSKSMHLQGASVMVLDRDSRSYLVRAGDGVCEKAIGSSIPDDSALLQEITVHYSELNRDEIEHRIKNSTLKTGEKERLSEVLAEMDRLKAVLIVPSVSESEYFNRPTLLSTINLGEKSSGESFTGDDIDFLKTIANQSAISVEYTFILEELKKKQEQMLRSEKMAALGNTVAGIAHELKNPLTYLYTVAQSMAASWDQPEFRASVIKMFPQEVERMKLIIEGLSDYSKSHELRLEPTPIEEVIERVLLILGHDISKGKIFITKNYSVDKPVLAMADRHRVVQVFMNIIANAVQAMSEKGGDLSITVRENEKEVRVSVVDSGPGILREDLQRIFDPFFTTKESGTGLGLSVTKKIIEEHRGSIYVDSYAGEGTTFTVCLPRA